MLIYISSGSAVAEVCRALWHFMNWIDKEGLDYKIAKIEYAKCNRCYKLIVLSSNDSRFRELEGVILWQSKSPFRPKHKRKNWFFTLTIHHRLQEHIVDTSKVEYEVMRAPKKGGQKVNKSSCGVRVKYRSLNLEAVSFDSRSQAQNRKIALNRLIKKANLLNEELRKNREKELWSSIKYIKRGEAKLVFEGEEFKLKTDNI